MRSVRRAFCHCLFLLHFCFIACSDEDIERRPVLTFDKQILFIDHLSGTGLLTLRNEGDIYIDWSLTEEDSFISVSPFSGRLLPSESIQVEIRSYKSELSEGLFQTNLVLSTDKTPPRDIAVHVLSYVEQKMVLENSIVDATYDKLKDRIVAVTADSKLIVIDPKVGEETFLNLDFPAVCLSLSQNGKHAVVGHAAAISYIDIDNRTILKKIGLPVGVNDLVLAPNNWVYIMPNEMGNRNFYNLDLNTEEGHWPVFFDHFTNAKISLHPFGTYMYAYGFEFNNLRIQKIDSDKGISNYNFDPPKELSHPTGKNIWISDDGKQFFTETGKAFRISEDPQFDMTYVASVSDSIHYATISQSSKAERIFGIYRSNINLREFTLPDDLLMKYDMSYQLIGQEALPAFLMEGAKGQFELVQGKAFYGFFNTEGSQYYVLSKAVTNNREQWALITIDVN